jgi:hypothetical protein
MNKAAERAGSSCSARFPLGLERLGFQQIATVHALIDRLNGVADE